MNNCTFTNCCNEDSTYTSINDYTDLNLVTISKCSFKHNSFYHSCLIVKDQNSSVDNCSFINYLC